MTGPTALISGKRLEQVYSPQAKPDLELRELVGVTITSSSDLSRWFTSWSIIIDGPYFD